ncbi:hypothetical protein H8356DRAFT_1334206 [Neocallimastix lanati (nom. inval.)]|jgi:hypothetical protein|uniref:Vacuolar ATPase assembly integral membrane protein VMA21 n=1 Tax=Neocallimastix californiae TaxID=1754190 RepID=A0A1Y2D6G9_9FUNG|nr:hypothetical protein H8356DRAFT_1334206 [Neocallimastix sp. JGI-2020a]ORY54901.1 hypothetical protein LY90DRAFT_507321 [Neocallimastix californiae]|eukprot:ORY54901.1 hypothetical protein LY90DRAFT_507321 [Neocallimastix californiae]
MTKKDAKATSSPVKEKAETVPTEPASTSETKPENTTINQPEKPRVYNKKIPWWILTKLLFFTFLLFGLPIFTYFYTQAYVFPYEPVYCAVAAVVSVNIVLVLYILVAALSDRPSKDDKKKNE